MRAFHKYYIRNSQLLLSPCFRGSKTARPSVYREVSKTCTIGYKDPKDTRKGTEKAD